MDVPIFVDGTGPLFAFPNAKVITTEDKKALLAMGACNDAVAYMFSLSRRLFKGRTFQQSPSQVAANSA